MEERSKRGKGIFVRAKIYWKIITIAFAVFVCFKIANPHLQWSNDSVTKSSSPMDQLAVANRFAELENRIDMLQRR